MASNYIVNRKTPLDNAPQRASHKKKREVKIYELMHKERVVASITSHGVVQIFQEQFLPIDLYLEEDMDPDVNYNNRVNFEHWCASRMLSIDRKYAKAILNSIGVTQSTTDQDRAKISLSYHCVSLTDVYWVREQGDPAAFAEINLYSHSLDRALVEVSLRGKSMTATNRELAPDLSTQGLFAKAWVRREDGFYLWKDGGEEVVHRELLASQIARCFDIPQVLYEFDEFEGEPVTRSKILTSMDRSIFTHSAFDIYCDNHDCNAYEWYVTHDPIAYYGMNILDYLTGNSDRHGGNWGVLVDNATNQPISLYPLMDFNQCFNDYDTLEGGRCLTLPFGIHMSQRAAAVEAVRKIGLRQKQEIDLSIFDGMEQFKPMFLQRLEHLKQFASKPGEE